MGHQPDAGEGRSLVNIMEIDSAHKHLAKCVEKWQTHNTVRRQRMWWMFKSVRDGRILFHEGMVGAL